MKPYSCDICGRAFKDRNAVRQHARDKHDSTLSPYTVADEPSAMDAADAWDLVDGLDLPDGAAAAMAGELMGCDSADALIALAED